MLEIKEKFVDRVEQSIVILKNNVLKITLPMVIFNILFLVIIPTVIFQLIPLTEMFSWDISQKIWIYMSFGLALWGLYFLIFLLVLIPVQIAIIKSIGDSIHAREIDMKANLHYGFSSISNVFRTYWYIFSYVYLIPAGIFILGGVIFISWTLINREFWNIPWIIWGILMGISVLVFLVFAVYRGTKSTFWVMSAVDKQEYTKTNLQKSIRLSDWKWWRIFWNLFGIGFIIWAVLQLLKFIWSIFLAFSYDWTELITASQSDDVNVQELITEFTTFQPLSFINNIIQAWFGSILWTLIVIFAYLLFKRLETESNASPVMQESEKLEL